MTEWKTLLQPWLDALKSAALRVKLPSQSTVSDADALQPWVQIMARVDDPNDTNDADSDAAWLLLVEAMEMLELLARVDAPVAWHLLTNLHADSATAWGKAQCKDIEALPRFKLIVHRYALFQKEETTFKGLNNMSTIAPVRHSATYAETKDLMLAKWAECHDGKAFDRGKEGYVEMLLPFKLPDLGEPETTDLERVFSRI